jgi:hypothetical protein
VRSAREARAAQAQADARFNDLRQLAHFVLFDFDTAIASGITPARKLLIEKTLDYLNRLSARGGDPSLQRELIRGYAKVGDLQGNLYGPNLGDPAAARESYSKSLRIAQSLQAAYPSDPQWSAEAAFAGMKLGDLLALGSARTEALKRIVKPSRSSLRWPPLTRRRGAT